MKVPYRIFLSHSTKDQYELSQIQASLEADGHHAWYCTADIETAAPWKKAILDELEDRDIVVVLWSNNALMSDWVLREAREAIKHKKYLPVVLQRGVNLPDEFNGLQLCFSYESNFRAKLRTAVARIGEESRRFKAKRVARDTIQTETDVVRSSRRVLLEAQRRIGRVGGGEFLRNLGDGTLANLMFYMDGIVKGLLDVEAVNDVLRFSHLVRFHRPKEDRYLSRVLERILEHDHHLGPLALIFAAVLTQKYGDQLMRVDVAKAVPVFATAEDMAKRAGELHLVTDTGWRNGTLGQTEDSAKRLSKLTKLPITLSGSGFSSPHIARPAIDCVFDKKANIERATADTYVEIGELRRAKMSILSARREHLRIGQIHGVAMDNTSLARIERLRGANDQAEALECLAAELFSEVGDFVMAAKLRNGDRVVQRD